MKLAEGNQGSEGGKTDGLFPLHLLHFLLLRILTVLFLATLTTVAGQSFDLRDGNRVVLIGDALIEREQESGWLEMEMASDFPRANITVRNLGWSADTPAGVSRASVDYQPPRAHPLDRKIKDPSEGFANPAAGFAALCNQVKAVRPTVVVVGYGMACSFGGAAQLEHFKSDLARFVDTVQSLSTNQIRFIFLSPIQHQRLPAPMRDPSAHNADLELYTSAIRELAMQRSSPFVDLYHWHSRLNPSEITVDGIHLTPEGYQEMAHEVARQLGWSSHLNSAKKGDLEALRQSIIWKNDLYSCRWRPVNDTFFSGFRNNVHPSMAKEVPGFDLMTEKADEEIARLRTGVSSNAMPAPLVPQVAVAPSQSKSAPMPVFDVAPGFEVQLWAEDPMLNKPIQMNFDAKGRLWVASTTSYPQVAPGQKPNDEIVILQDTSGSGKADKSAVFADGLAMPEGVLPDADGNGCYVTEGAELVHLRDSRTRGKADVREVLASGFGVEDTHHTLHTPVMGPDGILYMNQGLHIHSDVETPAGIIRYNGGGVFQFNPATKEVSVFLRGFYNPWGHRIDPYGQSFLTEGADGGTGVSWGMRNAEYNTYLLMRRELKGICLGSNTKFCGLELVTSPQFPENWQGDFIAGDYRAHRVIHYSRSDDGAAYIGKPMADLLTTTNETFRPVDMKFGPDGALYVADFVNPIIQHAEIDFRDPRRDHLHGRIWRITAKGRPLVRHQDLTKLSNTELCTQLLSSNLLTVYGARRLLSERGDSALKAVRKWAASQKASMASLETLWIYQSAGVRDDNLLDEVLNSPDGRVRAAGAKALVLCPRAHVAETGPDKGRTVPDDCYGRLLSDSFPRVRVEALRALAVIPSLRSADLALSNVKEKMDPFEDYALWLTMNELSDEWVDGYVSGAWNPEGRSKQWEFALNAIKPDFGGEIFKKQPLTPDGPAVVLDMIGRSGHADDLNSLYQKLLAGFFNNTAAEHAIAALEVAAPRNLRPTSDLDKIGMLFDGANERVRLGAVRLAGRWGVSGGTLPKLLALAGESATPPNLRAAAFESIRMIGGKSGSEGLESLAGTNQSFQVREAALLSLARIDVRRHGPATIAFLSGITNSEEALNVWRNFLVIAGSGAVAADLLPKQGLPRVVGMAGIRALRESGRLEPQLVVALSRAAGLPVEAAELSAGELRALAANVYRMGNAARGETIFRSSQQSCLTCHAIGHVGGQTGPDLTSVGASSQMDYLIESVLYPNKKIKEGYAAALIDMDNDDHFTGIPVREDERQLVIRTAADAEVSIEKAHIKNRKPAGSLMPSGLTDSLSFQEQLDLYRFLSELGKPGPFDASKANVARLWKVTADPLTEENEKKLITSGVGGESWHRAISFVNGRMPVKDLEAAVGQTASGNNAPLLAGSRFRSVKSGEVKLEISAPDKSTVWIDGNVCEPRPQMASASAQPTAPPTPKVDTVAPSPPMPPVIQTSALPHVPVPGFRGPPAPETNPAFNHPAHYVAGLPAGTHTIVVKLTGVGATAFVGARSDDGVFLGSADQ